MDLYILCDWLDIENVYVINDFGIRIDYYYNGASNDDFYMTEKKSLGCSLNYSAKSNTLVVLMKRKANQVAKPVLD
jgi:hypothetical protein